MYMFNEAHNDLQKMKVNTTKIRKIVQADINFVLGKNGGHRPNSLDGRSVIVVSE